MISAETKLFALIGDPVRWSLSPVMYNAAFKALGLDCAYVALRVPREMLADAIAGVRALGIVGLNVTHPHKTGILDMLDELDESASSVGAVNTVKNDRGRLIGFNTDGLGAVEALKQKVGGFKGSRVLLLGAGGAARAIAFSLAKEGVGLTIANRTVAKARELASTIEEKLGARVLVSKLERAELLGAIKRSDILINATTVGMSPASDRTLVTAGMMHRGLVVFDIVYEPLRTKLLREAKQAGAKTIDGLGMLVNQGAMAFEILAGKRAPIEVMEEAAKRRLRG